MPNRRPRTSGVGRHDEFVDLALKRALECGAQLGHEEQRAAEEDDGAVNRASGSQAGDGLRGHRGEDRRGQIGLGGAVVDQRLQVGLREHAATRRDRVQGLVVLGVIVEAEASVSSSVAIWSMNAPVPPAHEPFMRCSGVGFRYVILASSPPSSMMTSACGYSSSIARVSAMTPG